MTRPGSGPDPSFEDWQAKVRAETGLEDLARLASQPFPGLSIEPLYVDAPAKARELSGVGGPAPAGSSPLGGSSPTGETSTSRAESALAARGRSCPRIRGAEAESWKAVTEAWTGGARSVWVDSDLAPRLPELDAWDEADFAVIEPGPTFPDLTELRSKASIRTVFGEDPLSRVFAGTLEAAAAPEAMSQWCKRAFPQEGVYPVLISAADCHEAGGHAAQEIGFALSGALQWFRAWEADGHDLDTWRGGLCFRFVLSQDVFVEIGKLRAFRRCWERIVREVGLSVAETPPIHTVDAHRMLSFRDPWNNMIRSSLSGFASIVGGAQIHTTHAYDARFAESDETAVRMARNTNLILNEESRLDHVVDPAGGSYFLESLTEDLARMGWEEFQRIESEGGLLSSLKAGAFVDRVRSAWEDRASRLRSRKISVVGVSDYAKLEEELPAGGQPAAAEAKRGTVADGSAPDQRFDGDPFESLRSLTDRLGVTEHSTLPGRESAAVFLATLGPRKHHAARSAFARDAFAAAGLVADNADDLESAAQEDWATSAAAQFQSSGTKVACICGRDEDYATHASAVAAALRAAGARRILLAGKRDATRDDGIDDWIHLGSDLATSLEGVVDALGLTKETGGVS